MTVNDLHAIGQYLFGGGWQTALADAIGVSDRNMRRWASGHLPVPPGAWQDIINLAAEKQVYDAWPVIEGMHKKYGKSALVELYISGVDDKVASIHKRTWTRETDITIKTAMVDLLKERGLKAEVREQ